MRFALQSTSRLYLIAHCVRGVEGATWEHKRKGQRSVWVWADSQRCHFRDIPRYPTLNDHRDRESLWPTEASPVRRNTSGGSDHPSRGLSLHIPSHPHLGRNITVAALASLACVLRLAFKVLPQVFVCVRVCFNDNWRGRLVCLALYCNVCFVGEGFHSCANYCLFFD